MNRTILLLSVTALALGGTSAYLWQQLRHEHALRQASVARTAELEERLRLMAVGKPDVQSHFDTRAPTATTMPAPLAALAASQPKREASNGKDRPLERSHTASESPEVRAVKLAQARMSVRRRLPDLAAALHLEEEEADKLVDLLAEQQLKFEPPFVPEGELEYDVNNKPEWVRKMEEEQRGRDKEIAELLGEEKFRAWQEYGASGDARRLVRELRPMLDGTSDSLREDQMPLLIKAIAEAQQRFGAESGNGASTDTGLERFARYNERLREAAVPYLSTGQLARFDQMLDEQLEVARVRSNTRSVQAETEAPGNTRQ